MYSLGDLVWKASLDAQLSCNAVSNLVALTTALQER